MEACDWLWPASQKDKTFTGRGFGLDREEGACGQNPNEQFSPSVPHLSATLASTTAFGGTFHGQLIRPPGNLLKSNWQQILGSGPQV